MLQLAEKSVKPETRLVIFPETSLTEPMDESALNNYPAVQKLRDFCRAHNGLTILTGADTYHFFKEGEKISATARLYQGKQHYDAYNTALLIDTTQNIQVYHKSKLVPGVEQLPYPQVFAPLEKMFNLGGTSGSLGIQDTAEVFTTRDGIVIAPIICYESIYGDWVGAYVRNNANLLCIITNDGWWRNTPGYRQHLHYARLRAIEMRRDIARSANTGISAYIDHRGRILEQTEWWVPAQLNRTVNKRTGMTFYAQTGDYIGKIAAWLAILLMLATFVKARMKKKY
jgi:apolipoprotein N-acyltransferase